MITLRRFKVLILASASILTLAMIFAFLFAPSLGSAYLMFTTHLGSRLPILTNNISLPILLVAPPDPHNRPVFKWWVLLIWLHYLAAPTLITWYSLRAQDLTQCIARWVLGISLYLSLVLLFAIFIFGTLVIPFACM